MAAVPPGFVMWKRTSPFIEAAIGRLWVDWERMVFGVALEDRHTNTRGLVHGGLLTTVADLALGHTAGHSVEPQPSLSTLSLSVDFVAAARPGEWLEASAEVLKVGGTAAFARCLVSSNHRTILRASGVFALNERR